MKKHIVNMFILIVSVILMGFVSHAEDDGGFQYEDEAKTIVSRIPNVEDVVLPSSVEYIREGAFSGCEDITSLTFSKKFKKIWPEESGEVPISEQLCHLKNLRYYKVEAGNKTYKSVNGLLYSKDGATLYAVPPGYEGKVEITAGTMTVEEYAFYNCSKITSVNIPYGVTRVRGFENCNSLTSVTVAASVYGGPIFRNCSNLRTIKYLWEKPNPYFSKSIKNCPNLETIYVPKGCKATYKKYIKPELEKLLKEGTYKPQTKKVESLSKTKGSVQVYGEEICFAWKEVLYAKGYRIQKKVNGKWKTIKTINTPYTTEYSTTTTKLAMKDGGIYYFRIVADRDGVKSISSPYKACYLKKPKLLSVKQTENGTLVVEWKAHKNVSGYYLSINGSDGSYRKITVKGGTKSKKTVTGLKKGVKYTVCIYTYKDGIKDANGGKRISANSNLIAIKNP